MGKIYQYGDEILEFIKGVRLLYGTMKSVHRKVLSSTEENVRTLIVWRVLIAWQNLREKYMFWQKQESLSVHLSLYTDRHLLACSADNKPTRGC